jgi:hypothetical protein
MVLRLALALAFFLPFLACAVKYDNVWEFDTQ